MAKESDYTADSWSAMQTKLTVAKAASLNTLRPFGRKLTDSVKRDFADIGYKKPCFHINSHGVRQANHRT